MQVKIKAMLFVKVTYSCQMQFTYFTINTVSQLTTNN